MSKAESDLQAAQKLATGNSSLHDQVCFHCQQSAEKYLKALLEEAGLKIPRTHELEELLELNLPTHPKLQSLRRGLSFLNDFAVEYRYPGVTARKR